jgi:hypothetical protein
MASAETMKRWRKHFQNLLRDSATINTEITHEFGGGLEKDMEGTEEQQNKSAPPTTGDVKKDKDRLKNNRSLEPDNLIEELFQT